MKKRRIQIAIVIAVFLIGWWFLKPSGQQPKENKIASAENAKAITKPTKKDPSPLTSRKIVSPTSLINTNAELQRRFELRKKGAERMNVQINFWGKVVDQDNQPLAGVKIHLTTRDWYAKSAEESSAHFPHYGLETGPDGFFQLLDAHGDSLDVDSIEKEGYELSSKVRRSFGYNRPEKFIADPHNPVVFKMWKKMGGERLIRKDKFFGIIPDGRTYTIDLVKGEKYEGRQSGDLFVSVSRPPDVKRSDVYDWSFKINVPEGGGIIESTNEFMNLAPETGYQPHYEFSIKSDEQKWRYNIEKQFFVKTQNGLYARVNAEIFAYYDKKGVVSLKYFLNPSGSRNLEYDPKVYLAPWAK